MRALAFFFLALFIQSTFANSQDAPEVKTGRIQVETTTNKILGAEMATQYQDILAGDEKIKWSIYIPETYDPATPPGILIHMTMNKMAKLPFGWKTSMDDKNMIWISLNKSTNRMIQNKEMLINIFSTPFLESNYKINSDRIYIVASADSCYPASAAAQLYPAIIKGAIYTTCDPINWRENVPDSIDIMRQNRFVFISSNEKPVQQAMRRAVRRYNDAGITKTEYLNIPKLIYGRNIDRRKLNSSIDMLDVR